MRSGFFDLLRPKLLLHMLAYHFGKFKHRDLAFSAKHYFQLLISIDHTLVLLVLKFVLLDVVPDFFDDLSSRHCFAADYFSE